jgi:conjugative relaxase-like TrwC/TraI family protein
MMSAHKITAGHGYTYLTSQVAAQDAGAILRGGLGAYYSERGESPGQWLGSGLGSLDLERGSIVREEQMIALFGEGRHPDTATLTRDLSAQGADGTAVAEATALGRPFELNLANNEYLRMVAQLTAEWNRAQGQPGCVAAPAHVRSMIRTMVAEELFAQTHNRRATDARELAGFIAAKSRIGSRAVAGFDLTFSPVKSVSALWAVAPRPVADQIRAAHDAAVADTLAWLERTAAFTRLGRNGVRQVDTRGLIAAAFVHRSSRAGDPDLHTHVAVSNKVQTLDGRWRALDGRVLLKATVAASERYNTRLEAELRDRLGLSFVEYPRPGRRPVREIAGMDDRLLGQWSRRRAAIDATRGDLAQAFLAKHRRPPTPVESIELAQQATLQTRPDKVQPMSEGDQRRRWRAEAEETLGGERLPAMIDAVLSHTVARPLTSDGLDMGKRAQQVIDRVQQDRATWQRWHVAAEAQRVARGMNLPVVSLEATVKEIVRLGLDECSVPLTRADVTAEPSQLHRRDGESVYQVAGSQLYTSQAVLDAEQIVLDAADTFDGNRVEAPSVEMALLESTANGLTLNDGQARFIRVLGASGARCQLGLAPAGTGKTTALRVLVRAWQENGGQVLALAPSAAAARVLGDAAQVPADTVAKALHDLNRGTLPLDDRALVVVDEAGMAATTDLANLTRHAVAAGASIRLIGDDRQLAAIGAGGLLRDLAENRSTVRLSDAVRFADPSEATAALGIRDGKAGALDFYLDTRRVHAGDEFTAATSAYQAWRVDRATGRDSLLLASTRKRVTELNLRARADRLGATGDGQRAEVTLADGSRLSAGDEIVTRRNERRIPITATDWVKNGDRWTVHAVHSDGGITAVHRDTGHHIALPADYVARHVGLGYAMTIHSAQGSTADTCHVVITGSESREQLYVALSRGRLANYIHVALPGANDEHAAIRPETLNPLTPLDILHRILDREEAQHSATTQRSQLVNPQLSLRDAAARYADAVQLAPASSDALPMLPAPLPWLPPVPSLDEEGWSRYLTARAQQITDLADRAIDQSLEAIPANDSVDRRDPALRHDWALWRMTHPSEGRQALSRREMLYQRHLEDRRTALIRGHMHDDARRWMPLVAAVAPAAVGAQDYRRLAATLTRAFDAKLDVDGLLPRLLQGQDVGAAVTELGRLVDQQTTTHAPRPDTHRHPSMRVDLEAGPPDKPMQVRPDL